MLETLTQAQELFEHTDVYLIDQILKGRYKASDSILDTGCGGGRNLRYFAQGGFDLWGNDPNSDAVQMLTSSFALPPSQFVVSGSEALPFQDKKFKHIICSAVLHFAENELHFYKMWSEMTRVLEPGGSIFVRMSTVFGLEGKILPAQDGHWHVNPGSGTFLLTEKLLREVCKRNDLQLAEPLKTVLVLDEVHPRSMGVLVLEKL